MPLFLSKRDTTSTERMDDPDCDPSELENTYRQFGTINALISQWRRVYKQEIRPFTQKTGSASLLDIGFGGGDIPMKLTRRATDDNIDLKVTAIDTDKRAIDYVQQVDRPGSVEFLHCSPADLIKNNRRFDFVISNHLLHHLSGPGLSDMLERVQQLSRRSVIFNDIHRSDLAYLFFNLLSRPVFQSSFITGDGLTSIKRSYTHRELKKAVPNDWEVRKLFPFRLLLIYNHHE